MSKMGRPAKFPPEIAKSMETICKRLRELEEQGQDIMIYCDLSKVGEWEQEMVRFSRMVIAIVSPDARRVSRL